MLNRSLRGVVVKLLAVKSGVVDSNSGFTSLSDDTLNRVQTADKDIL